MFEVLKAFNTVNRRLQPGTELADTDDISPFTFEERESRGFIKPRPQDLVAASLAPTRPGRPGAGAKTESEPAV